MPSRRGFLGGLAGGLLTGTAAAAEVSDGLCVRSYNEDIEPLHPYSVSAEARYRRVLQAAKERNLPLPPESEINTLRDKDCMTCARVSDRLRTELVWSNDGNLPLLIAVPHGGTELVLEVNPRQNTDIAEQFNINSAVYTYEMARTLRYALEDKFLMRPFLVACLAHRRYVDVNRPPKDAYVMREENNDSTLPIRYRRSGAPIYFEYHCAMRRYVGNLFRRHKGRALLIELTGAQTYPGQIVRSTIQGRSVLRLRERVGDGAMSGPESLGAFIENRGYESDPPSQLPYPSLDCVKNNDFTDACRLEVDDTPGIYTLNTYGSHNANGIDALQISIGRDLRTTENYERTARDLAQAVADFVQKYYL